MNEKIICYLLGRLCAGIAAALALPFFLALHYQEGNYLDFIFAIAVTALVGFSFNWYAGKTNTKDISVREWISVVVFGWILGAGLSSLPYVFNGVLNPVDAYFESMSGLTTTGITAITNITEMPKSLMFWRSLTGWFGGIASIVVFVAVLPMFPGTAVYLFNSEASGYAKVGVLPRMRDSATTLLTIYFVLTLVLAIVLIFLGLSTFEAVNYACSTISTTGFAIHDSNMAYWEDSIILYITAFFMILAGGNFALYFQCLRKGFKVLWQDMEFKGYLYGIAVIAVLIAANVFYIQGGELTHDLTNSYFQTISFASTTGYTISDYNSWPTFAKMLLGLILFTGGCSGSAASGLKIGRVIVLVKILFLELKRVLHPKMLISVIYNKRALAVSSIVNMTRFFFVYVLVVVLFSFPLAAAGLSPDEALFGSASCLSNNGPAFGMLGAVNAYAGLPMITKMLMCVGMLLGRLEIFIVLAMLRKEFWRSTKRW